MELTPKWLHTELLDQPTIRCCICSATLSKSDDIPFRNECYFGRYWPIHPTRTFVNSKKNGTTNYWRFLLSWKSGFVWSRHLGDFKSREYCIRTSPQKCQKRIEEETGQPGFIGTDQLFCVGILMLTKLYNIHCIRSITVLIRHHSDGFLHATAFLRGGCLRAVLLAPIHQRQQTCMSLLMNPLCLLRRGTHTAVVESKQCEVCF